MHSRQLLLALLLVTLVIQATPHPAYATTQAIYTDGLAQSWANYSWTSVNLASASPTHTGSTSISVTYAAWGGLYLAHPGVPTAGYTRVRFWIHGGAAGGQQINLHAYLADNSIGPDIAIPAPAAGTWSEVSVTLASLGVANSTLRGLVWQDSTGGAQPTLSIDDIALVDDASPDGPVVTEVATTPAAAPADGQTSLVVRARVSDPQGAADIAAVTVDASAIGRGAVALRDDGRSNDGAAGDGLYGALLTIAAGTPPGEAVLALSARDQASHIGSAQAGTLTILSAPGGAIPGALPQQIAWGTNEWSEPPAQDWQVASGVPWQYAYQYITYDWYQNGWGGDFVGRFARQAWGKGYVPVISAYLILGTPPECGETPDCYIGKLQNPSAVSAYLAAIGEAARQASGVSPVIFHLDPDFYGYMQQYTNRTPTPAGARADDPTSIAVALNVPGYPNTLVGFGRRVVDVIHANAPNALVAPHASMWATGKEPWQVTAAEAQDQARRTAAFISAIGDAQSEIWFVEWSDRDSGSGLRPWWDDTNRVMPSPARAVLWENALSAAAGKRLILWQMPCGNMGLNNTPNQYQDNRAAYAFAHPRDLIDAGVVAVLFGGGTGEMTRASTDGGFIAAQGGIAYAPPGAPGGLASLGVSGPTATVRWDERSEPDIWGYRVTYQRPNGSQSATLDLRRANVATIVLPDIGEWRVSVAAYDAQGRVGPSSGQVSVTTTEAPQRIFLPLVAR